MPDRSDKVLRKYEEADEYELPYISKSRIEQWLKNPEHFRLKYLEEIDEPETFAMRRGTNIHETFEHYYNEALDNDYYPGLALEESLPSDRRKWADFIEPHISNFLKWENDRWRASGEQCKHYLPVSVEEEQWNDDIMSGAPEWMGLADVILRASACPWIDADEGVVIVDFKTGKVPSGKYRSPGIYTELAYYSMLFEDKYDVAGAAAYYPKEDTTLTLEDDAAHREKVMEAAEEMVESSDNYDGTQKFEAKEGPLCGWSSDPDDRSSYYGICSQCSWNVPVDNQNQFEQLVDEGYTDGEIGEHLGCSTNACSYWRYKLDLGNSWD